MATYSKELLSGSTQGKGVKVAATSTAGTTIHTTGTSATIKDELWLYAVNSDTTARLLTVEFGGTTSPDNVIQQTIPPQSGLMLLVPGITLNGDGSSGAVIRAFAATANVIVIYGFVNRITP